MLTSWNQAGARRHHRLDTRWLSLPEQLAQGE
jgi:hypothetical protein